jgi:hypothetical protein
MSNFLVRFVTFRSSGLYLMRVPPFSLFDHGSHLLGDAKDFFLLNAAEPHVPYPIPLCFDSINDRTVEPSNNPAPMLRCAN